MLGAHNSQSINSAGRDYEGLFRIPVVRRKYFDITDNSSMAMMFYDGLLLALYYNWYTTGQEGVRSLENLKAKGEKLKIPD